LTQTSSACDDFFSKLGCVAAVLDCFIPIPPIPPPFNFIMCGFGIGASCGPWDAGAAGCIGVASGLTCLAKELICKRLVGSLDPNDIIGPEGYGDRRWVAVSHTLPYQIRFENDPQKATAPAQRVSITQQLDSTVDIRSFRLNSIGFANQTFDIPGNPSYYSTRVDVRDSLGIYVDVTAGINVTNGQVFWNFKSIDPNTGEQPGNPLIGLLPINDSTGRGNGYVRYTVRPKSTSKTGDLINAKARIVFDQNEPLDTPPIYNTIDAVSPISNVRPLHPITTFTSFPLTWGGKDDSSGSNLKSYSIYVSRNDSPYVAWLINTTDTMAIYTGSNNSHYKFFSLATDYAGNTEPTKFVADATTQIITSVEDKPIEIPKEFALYQNYPNPFNPTTTIRYDLPTASHVVLKVYNILGQEVVVLIDEQITAGRHQTQFNSTNLASGVYFYKLVISDFVAVKKFILLK
jgi:acetyltransferase-like isoleucine patch superfamily enzyme